MSTAKNRYSIRSTLHSLTQQLKESGISNAEQEAKWLLGFYMELTPSELILHANRPISADVMAAVDKSSYLRTKGTPLSRILGEQEFYGIRLKLCPSTLDPRPDTELIPDLVLRRYGTGFRGTFLDLGTGSGCISLAILTICPHSCAIALDLCAEALSCARLNARLNGLENRFLATCGDWADSLDGKFPLIVSNPPYIRREDMPHLAPEVKNFDPATALDGGRDGLDSIKRVIAAIKRLLLPNGRAFIEIGKGQEEQVRRILENPGLTLIDVHPDISGIPRVVEISHGDK